VKRTDNRKKIKRNIVLVEYLREQDAISSRSERGSGLNSMGIGPRSREGKRGIQVIGWARKETAKKRAPGKQENQVQAISQACAVARLRRRKKSTSVWFKEAGKNLIKKKTVVGGKLGRGKTPGKRGGGFKNHASTQEGK